MTRRNNFDAIRLLAAIAVLFSHSFLIADGTQQNEPFLRLNGNQAILGLLAVFVFFTISGFLITQSYLATASAGRFALKRALRIFPGLAVNLLVCALLLGPLVTSLPLDAYFSDPRLHQFLAQNFALRLGDNPLPGVVFADNPVGAVVNGSLWTLRFEVMMYLMVLILGSLRLLRLSVSLVLLAMGIAGLYFEQALGSYGDLAGWSWLLSFFAAGMCLYFLRDSRIMRWDVAAAAVLGLVAITLTHTLILLFSVFGGFLTIFLALKYTPALSGLSRFGDLSYGVYVWGWPVAAWVLWMRGGEAEWWEVFSLSLLICLPIAWLSWHGVEKPMLRLARGPSALRPPRLQPQPAAGDD